MHRIRISLLACSLLLASPHTVLAGTARAVALGGDSSYFADSANVLLWYASLDRFPDLLILEAGDVIHGQDRAISDMGWVGHGGGAHVRLSESGGAGTAAFYFQDHLDKADDDGAFAFLYGRHLGSWRLGLAGRFTTYGQFHARTDGATVVDGQYFHHYGLGLGHGLGGAWDAELAGEIINTMTDYPRDAGAKSSDTWKSYGLRLRLHGRLGDGLTLVPVVSRTRRQGGFYSDLLAGPADRDADLTTLGVGVNLRRPDDALVVISGEYRKGGQDWRLRTGHPGDQAWDSSLQNFYQIRGRLAVESELLEGLTLRVAAQYLRHHSEIERTTFAGDSVPVDRESILDISVATPLSLGLAWRHGPLTLDAAYNDTAPLNTGLAGENLTLDDQKGYSAVTLTRTF